MPHPSSALTRRRPVRPVVLETTCRTVGLALGLAAALAIGSVPAARAADRASDPAAASEGLRLRESVVRLAALFDTSIRAGSDAPRNATPPAFDAVAKSFESASRETRKAVLAEVSARAVTPGERFAAIAAASGASTQDCIVVATSAATPPGGEALPSLVLDAYQRVIASAVGRDPAAVGVLHSVLPDAAPETLLRIVRACADAAEWRTADLVRRILDEGRAGPPAIEAAARLAGRVPPRSRRPIAEAIRTRIGSSDAAMAREASLAAGMLGDEEALEALVERVASPDAGTRDAALWSLRRISGLGLRPAVQPWKAWLDDEREWERKRGAEIEKGLASSRLCDVAAALNEVATRTIGHDRWTPAVARLCRHEEPAVRTTARALVRRLGSADAVPELLEAVAQPDPDVAAPAARIVEELTGLTPEAWRRAAQEGCW